jgi:hypothetical protein
MPPAQLKEQGKDLLMVVDEEVQVCATIISAQFLMFERIPKAMGGQCLPRNLPI